MPVGIQELLNDWYLDSSRVLMSESQEEPITGHDPTFQKGGTSRHQRRGNSTPHHHHYYTHQGSENSLIYPTASDPWTSCTPGLRSINKFSKFKIGLILIFYSIKVDNKA
ncbi:hypothetical protein AVEN_242500-1 [Araneus ventricosus]|uniref:Uncharacterized protein n=1 Tax=Araneus ventricosus TaxID=182803 RepID=A0A4Y2PH90_ARAVE|nr:hypothetical protein AVEN_242500-1 [Araneus ventricosus]